MLYTCNNLRSSKIKLFIYIYIYILRVAGAQRSQYYCSVSHRPWLFLLNDVYGIKHILFMLIMLYIYIN